MVFYIDLTVWIAMTLLWRGTHVYANKDDAHPIGMDSDIQVFNPSGMPIGTRPTRSDWGSP